MSWNDLSIADKAKVILLGVSNGITDLSSIKELYELPIEYSYQNFASDLSLVWGGDDLSKHGYDYESYYNSNPLEAFEQVLKLRRGEGSHFPDTYKLPSHPTFSTESLYSTEETPGGEWFEDRGVEIYKPNSYTELFIQKSLEYLRNSGEGISIKGNSYLPADYPVDVEAAVEYINPEFNVLAEGGPTRVRRLNTGNVRKVNTGNVRRVSRDLANTVSRTVSVGTPSNVVVSSTNSLLLRYGKNPFDLTSEQLVMALDMFNYLTGTHKLSKKAAAAIMGNIFLESSLDPEAINEKSGALGFLQLLGDHIKYYTKYSNSNKAHDVFGLLDYIMHALGHPEEYDFYTNEHNRVKKSITAHKKVYEDALRRAKTDRGKLTAEKRRKEYLNILDYYTETYNTREADGRLFPYSDLTNALNDSSYDLNDLTTLWHDTVERSSPSEANIPRRQSFANWVYNTFKEGGTKNQTSTRNWLLNREVNKGVTHRPSPSITPIDVSLNYPIDSLLMDTNNILTKKVNISQLIPASMTYQRPVLGFMPKMYNRYDGTTEDSNLMITEEFLYLGDLNYNSDYPLSLFKTRYKDVDANDTRFKKKTTINNYQKVISDLKPNDWVYALLDVTGNNEIRVVSTQDAKKIGRYNVKDDSFTPLNNILDEVTVEYNPETQYHASYIKALENAALKAQRERKEMLAKIPDSTFKAILNGYYNGRKFTPTPLNVNYFLNRASIDYDINKGYNGNQWGKVLGTMAAGALAAGAFSTLAGPALTTLNTLVTPSTYTTLLGLPSAAGTAANITASAGMFGYSAADFIRDPSVENALWTGLSIIPVTRAGTSSRAIGTIGNTIAKPLSRISKNAAKTYKSRMIENALLTEGFGNLGRNLFNMSKYTRALQEFADEYIRDYFYHRGLLEQLDSADPYDVFNLPYSVPKDKQKAFRQLNNNKRNALLNDKNSPRGLRVNTRPSKEPIDFFLNNHSIPHLMPWGNIIDGVHTDVTLSRKGFPDFVSGLSQDIALEPFRFPERGSIRFNPNYTYTVTPAPIAENGSPFSFLDYNVSPQLLQQIASNIDYVKNNFPGAVPFGSAISVLNNDLYHVPGDIDVLISEKAMKAKFGNNWPNKTRSYKGQLPETYVYDILGGIFGKLGELDLNVLYDSKAHKGETQPTDRALEVFLQFYPDEFYRAVKQSRISGEPIRIPYSPELLLAKVEENKEIKTIMDNLNADAGLGSAANSKSTKSKQLVRSFQYLERANPLLMKKALRMNGEAYLGSKYRSAPVTIDAFTDVETNMNILKKLKAPEEIRQNIAKDPQKMANYFEYWWLTTTLSSRGLGSVTPINNTFLKFKDNDEAAEYFMRYWNGGEGGTYSGQGLNTVVFGNSHHAHAAYGHILHHIPIPKNASPELIINTVNKDIISEDFELTLEMKNFLLERFDYLPAFKTFQEVMNYLDFPKNLKTADIFDAFARKFGISAHTLSNNYNSFSGNHKPLTGSYGNSLFRGFLRKLDHPDDLVAIGPGNFNGVLPASGVSRMVRVSDNKKTPIPPAFLSLEEGTHKIPLDKIPFKIMDEYPFKLYFMDRESRRLLGLIVGKNVEKDALEQVHNYYPSVLSIRDIPGRAEKINPELSYSIYNNPTTYLRNPFKDITPPTRNKLRLKFLSKLDDLEGLRQLYESSVSSAVAKEHLSSNEGSLLGGIGALATGALINIATYPDIFRSLRRYPRYKNDNKDYNKEVDALYSEPSINNITAYYQSLYPEDSEKDIARKVALYLDTLMTLIEKSYSKNSLHSYGGNLKKVFNPYVVNGVVLGRNAVQSTNHAKKRLK